MQTEIILRNFIPSEGHGNEDVYYDQKRIDKSKH